MRFARLALCSLLCLLAPHVRAAAGDRWVQATSLMLRAEPSPTAAIVGRLHEGSRVRLFAHVAGGEWCEVEAGSRMAFVACRYLSEQPVALPRAGEGGVPADRRWVGGSHLLLRAEPRRDSAVLGRLGLNTVLTLTGDEAGSNGYCAVQRVDGEPQAGYTACRYLQRSPLQVDKLTEPHLADGKHNPDFDLVRAFAVQPSWELMAHYARFVEQQRMALGDAAPTGPDEQLERMKAQLSGQVFDGRATVRPWPLWDAVRADARAARQAGREPDLLARLVASRDSSDQQLVAAFVSALPSPPPVSPSWWRSDADLAGPGEPLEELAARFGAKLQWLHASLQPGSRERGSIEPGGRIERLTRPLWRISLLADQQLRSDHRPPELATLEWDPTRDYNCPGWTGGFEHGDSDARTYARNGVAHEPVAGALTLFRFWSRQPLPPGPARWTRQAFKLDRSATGFISGEWRTVDLDGDRVPDLAWLQATGRGPGHLGNEPQHDDAWYRLLLANVAGRWRLLGEDAFSYGCGC